MSPIRVSRNDLFADILVDRRAPTDVWVYVVQREDGEQEDGEGFFLNGSSLSTGTFQVPVTRSHGS